MKWNMQIFRVFMEIKGNNSMCFIQQLSVLFPTCPQPIFWKASCESGWSSPDSESRTRSRFLFCRPKNKGLAVMRNTTVGFLLPSSLDRLREQKEESLEHGGEKWYVYFISRRTQLLATEKACGKNIPEGFMSSVNASWPHQIRRRAWGWLHRGNGKDQSPHSSTWGCHGRGH